MANRDAPFGLRPVRHRNGTPWNGAQRHVYVPAGDSTALFIGDPVVIVGDSNDNEVQGYPPGTLSEVTIATAGDGNPITGVVTGVLPVTDESTIYRAASTERILLIADDPDLIYEVQDDGSGTPTNDTVGLNANLVAGSGGSTVTGRSSWQLDMTTPGADASNQLLILNMARRHDNEVGVNAVWEVMINMHTYRATGDGDGSLGVA